MRAYSGNLRLLYDRCNWGPSIGSNPVCSVSEQLLISCPLRNKRIFLFAAHTVFHPPLKLTQIHQNRDGSACGLHRKHAELLFRIRVKGIEVIDIRQLAHVSGREVSEAPEKGAERDVQLTHGQVLADAAPRAPREGDETFVGYGGSGGAARGCFFGNPPAWIEHGRVRKCRGITVLHICRHSHDGLGDCLEELKKDRDREEITIHVPLPVGRTRQTRRRLGAPPAGAGQ